MLASHLFALLALPVGEVLIIDDDGGPDVDFTDLQPAIDLALDGDTLLVRPGTYTAFAWSGKSLVLTAEAGVGARVVGSSTIDSVPAGSRALLRNLDFEAAAAVPLSVANCGGEVWIEHCRMEALEDFTFARDGQPGLELDAVANALLLWSEVVASDGANEVFLSLFPEPGGTAVTAEDGSLVVYDSILRGGEGGGADAFGLLDGSDGGDALLATDLDLRISGSKLFGGDAGRHDFFDMGSSTDCGIPGAGGRGLVLDFFSQAVVFELKVTPGQGGEDGVGECPNGPDGESFAGTPPDFRAGIDRGFTTASPVRDGADALLYLDGEASDLGVILRGTPGPPVALGGAVSTLLLDLAAPLQVLYVGPADAGATAPLSVPIPQQPAGFSSATLFLQGLVLQANGVLRLSASASLTVLDDAL